MSEQQATIVVAVALLWRGGEVLVRRRRADEHLAGVWEFPGGKVGVGEPPLTAARRELREEMGLEIDARRFRPSGIVAHDYADRSVTIHLFEAEYDAGSDLRPGTPDGAEWAWLAPSELARRPIPDANRGLVERLMIEGRGR